MWQTSVRLKFIWGRAAKVTAKLSSEVQFLEAIDTCYALKIQINGTLRELLFVMQSFAIFHIIQNTQYNCTCVGGSNSSSLS